MNLYGASIAATLEFNGATLRAPGGHTLRAPGLILGGDLVLSALTSEGLIDLFGAEVKGQLWLTGAHLDGGSARWSLSAPQMKVSGGMYCRGGFTSRGGINLYDTSIGSTLELAGATLDNSDGLALRARGLSVAFDAHLDDNLSMTGGVDLTSATIGGALNLSGARIAETTFSLANSTVGTLRGQPTEAPKSWDLIGFTYGALDPYRPATEMLPWVGGGGRSYHPQPYEQLAQYYRSLGHDEQARTVQLAKQRHRRRGLQPVARAWGHVQDAALGYGYRPGRALLWLAVLASVMSIYFAMHPPHPGSATARWRPS